jgi:hypothetical protein
MEKNCMTNRYVSFASLGVLCLVSSTALAQFKIQKKNLNGNSFDGVCSEVTEGSNTYGSDTTTVREEGYWACSGSDCDDNTYRNYFERLTNDPATPEHEGYTAIGGRCETGQSSTIRGDGVAKIELYLHSNITDANRDGNANDPTSQVFTVGVMGNDNIVDEWDAFIFGDGVAASGSPNLRMKYPSGEYSRHFPGFEVPITSIDRQWITVTVTRENGMCSLNSANAGGTIASFPSSNTYYVTEKMNQRAWLATRPGKGDSDWVAAGKPSVLQNHKVPCRIDPIENNVRINSRASNRKFPNVNDGNDNSFVTVRKVAWEAKPSVVISEVRTASSQWVELYNDKSTAVDISGWVLTDGAIDLDGNRSDSTYGAPSDYEQHTYEFPSGTVIQPRAYFTVNFNVNGSGGFPFLLDAADRVQLFAPPEAKVSGRKPLSATLIDDHRWTAGASTSYARCLGASFETVEQREFTLSAAATKGAPNSCATCANGVDDDGDGEVDLDDSGCGSLLDSTE